MLYVQAEQSEVDRPLELPAPLRDAIDLEVHTYYVHTMMPSTSRYIILCTHYDAIDLEVSVRPKYGSS